MTSPDTSSATLRLTFLSVSVVVLFLALFSRLWYLQVLAGERYAELAESNRVKLVFTDAPRGRILDASSEAIVKNRPALTVSADPKELIDLTTGDAVDDEAADVLDRLTVLLDMTREEIVERLTSRRYSPFRPVPIKEDVAPETILAIRERSELFPGVVGETLPVRTYPEGQLAAHILGYVGEINEEELTQEEFVDYRLGDLIGKAGLERTYEQHLQGTEGLRQLEVNAQGVVLRVLDERAPVRGDDLVTTIDLDIQRGVEQALSEGIEASRENIHSSSGRPLASVGGAAVVLDPRDGSVVAMTSYPTYDPAEFVGGLSTEYARYVFDPDDDEVDNHDPILNRAVQAAHPPGSTWKIVTGLAALREGQITPDSRVPCPGSWGWGKRNWNPRNEGSMDLSRALMRSCDTFFYELSYDHWLAEERQADAGEEVDEAYQAVADELGFGRALGIDLPVESSGRVPGRQWKQEYWELTKDANCERAEEAPAGSYARRLYSELCNEGYVWRGGDAVNMSIGQGDVIATPLQLASAYAAIANGGTLYRPHIGGTIVAPNGEVVRTIEPEVLNEVPMTTAQLTEIQQGLTDVVMEPRGTAHFPFSDFPLDRITVAGKTGTAEAGPKIPYAWFASYAPADDPQYVVVVMVEEGGGGSQTAAPIAKRIYESIFDLAETEIEAGPGNVD